MARYPRAVYREVTGLQNDPPIIPVGMIVHVTASLQPSMFGWFNGPSGGIESHLHVPFEATTPAEQYRDTTREADANYRANSWVEARGRVGMVSVETQGLGPGAWTDHQVSELVEVGHWMLTEHGDSVPAIRATGPYSGGFGFHIQFPEWSNVKGKSCPGPIRIQQWNDLVLPAILGHLSLPPAGPGPVIVASQPPPVIVKPGVPAPVFPLPAGYYFGPKIGPAQSVSGYYSHREDLRAWQQRMADRGWSITVDGLYGDQTADITRRFQAEKHLRADGLIGPVTWAAAWTAPTT